MRLGTPENPEIIEPGQSPTSAQTHSFAMRVRMAVNLIMWMLMLSLPALFMDGVCYWLFQLIREGSLFAWILMALAIPPALALSLFAVVAVVILFFLLLATVCGAPVTTIQQTRVGRFVGSNLDRFPGR
jgi:hypothetical protein